MKKKNPTDSTMRNVRAANKKFSDIYKRLDQIEYSLRNLIEALIIKEKRK